MAKYVPHRYVKDQTIREELSDYMSPTVNSVESDTKVQDAAQFMHEKNIGLVLIKEKDEYIGIVTETDLTRKVLGGGLDPKTTKVTAVMTPQPIITLDCHLPVTDANAFMAKKKIRHLPVTENDKIVGMISVKDLVSFFANPRLR